MIPPGVVRRYVLIQLLGLVAVAGVLILIRIWIGLPVWLLIVLCVLWIAKDVALFPFVWQAYDWGSGQKTSPMVGMEGYVLSELDPEGYVEVRGERWKAERRPGETQLRTGDKIRVIDMAGLKLIVEHAGHSGNRSDEESRGT
ncbi:MAG: NfeD family protein [Desulfomonilia bacterium]